MRMFSKTFRGVSNCSLLQGIFPTQGSNPGLLHCRQILYQLSYKGSPQRIMSPKQQRSLLTVENNHCLTAWFLAKMELRAEDSSVEAVFTARGE